jgi:hypothetical protein
MQLSNVNRPQKTAQRVMAVAILGLGSAMGCGGNDLKPVFRPPCHIRLKGPTESAQCQFPPGTPGIGGIGGVEPRCGTAVWDGTTCWITGPSSGCTCYEGQTQSCLISDADQLCATGSPDCGVKWCTAAGTWGSCTMDL